MAPSGARVGCPAGGPWPRLQVDRRWVVRPVVPPAIDRSAVGHLTTGAVSGTVVSSMGVYVGFLSRLLVPRSVRRAMHPGRAVKRAITPKAVKKARRASHPVDNAVYSVQRSAATAIRSGGKRKAPVFHHGNCPVRHRSAEAAAKCRNP
jgi:hypothetical protein